MIENQVEKMMSLQSGLLFEEKFHPNSNLLELQMLYFVKSDAVRCLDMEFN